MSGCGLDGVGGVGRGRFGAGGVAGIGERTGIEVGLGDRMRAGAHDRLVRRRASRPGSRAHTRSRSGRACPRRSRCATSHCRCWSRSACRSRPGRRCRSSPDQVVGLGQSQHRDWAAWIVSGASGAAVSVLVAWPVSENDTGIEVGLGDRMGAGAHDRLVRRETRRPGSWAHTRTRSGRACPRRSRCATSYCRYWSRSTCR